MMALLSFRIVLLLFLKLVIISEIVCFTGHFLPNTLFSNSLNYVSKHLNSIQPQFNLQKLLIPKTLIENNNHAQSNAGLNNVFQQIPTAEITTATTTTKTNIEVLISNLSTERSNNNTTTLNSNVENKDIDEKWNSFFDDYFKNRESKTENILSIKNNEKTPKDSKDIYDNKNIETTQDSASDTTDTTDTTPFDTETTTGDDDLLRNGVPPELLSSLLG